MEGSSVHSKMGHMIPFFPDPLALANLSPQAQTPKTKEFALLWVFFALVSCVFSFHFCCSWFGGYAWISAGGPHPS